jgi:hypothetical protein
MFRKFEQNGRIKITHHVPGDFFVEANPKRQKIPDFKRTIVNPVVNGLKAKITKPPARVVKFDLVERPSGYQAMTPTPRMLTDIAPMVEVSQMLQAARIEKLQIDAPDKANTRFWTEYNVWADGTRLLVLGQAIAAAGQVNLVPIEINPLSISKWDWAVWFLSAMVKNKLIKKYQQTAVQLLKLFFETAQAADVAQMTPGTTNATQGWVFDEFSIIKMACQQLELPRDPEPYGFNAPYKVYTQEFANKTVDILLYLTANAVPAQVDKISSYNGTLLDFHEVKRYMVNPMYRLDLKFKLIEDNPGGDPASSSSSSASRPGAFMGPGAQSFQTPARFRTKDDGPADGFPWERDLIVNMVREKRWPRTYEEREEWRHNENGNDERWFNDLFTERFDPINYYEILGRDGILTMREYLKEVLGLVPSASATLRQYIIANVLHASTDAPPKVQTGESWRPFTQTMIRQKLQDNADYLSGINKWVKVVGNIFDPDGDSAYDNMMQNVNAVDEESDASASARSSLANGDPLFRSPMGNSLRERDRARFGSEVDRDTPSRRALFRDSNDD